MPRLHSNRLSLTKTLMTANWWKALVVFLSLQQHTTQANRIRKNNDPTARAIRIDNLSGSRVGIYWINLATEERVFQKDFIHGEKEVWYTFVMHEFELRERPSRRTGKCRGKNGVCRTRYFQVNDNEDQLVFIQPEFVVEHTDSRTKAKKVAKETIEKCRALYKKTRQREAIGFESNLPTDQLDELAACVEEAITTSLTRSREQITFESKVRTRMGNQLLSYACHDDNHATSRPLYEQIWNPSAWDATLPNQNHNMKILHETNENTILLMEDFITPSQCDAILAQQGHNHVDDKSAIDLSSTSKTNYVLWDGMNTDNDFLNVVTRMYALMNQWYGVTVSDQDGKIPIFQVHHDWKAGANYSPMLYSYTPPETSTSKVAARIIMVCQTPTQGGAIHFPETGIHINPKLGMAILINYINPTTRRRPKDEGMESVHVECPVLEGNRTTLNHVFFVPDVTPHTLTLPQ